MLKKNSIPMSLLSTPYICHHLEGIYNHNDPRQEYPGLMITLRAISGTGMAKQSNSEVTRRLTGTL